MRKEKMTLQEYEKKYIKYEGKSNLEMKPIRVVKAIKRVMEYIYILQRRNGEKILKLS